MVGNVLDFIKAGKGKSLWHKDYFELIIFKKQQMQEKF